ELPAALRPQKWSSERGIFEGEPVMLSFSVEDGRKRLQAVTRFEQQGDRLARVRAYCYCPETVREVGEALGLAVGGARCRSRGGQRGGRGKKGGPPQVRRAGGGAGGGGGPAGPAPPCWPRRSS